MVINEDRKVIAAVQKERNRSRTASRSSPSRSGRAAASSSSAPGRADGWAWWKPRRCRRRSARRRRSCRRSWPAARRRCSRPRKASRTTTRKGRAASAACASAEKDVVIGVSASGMTPFVRGGLTRARKAGAKIIFVTCWPGSELQNFVDLQIAPAVGPEIIAGSTRLKAGTATKMVLNMLTTVSMIKVGQDLRQPDGRRADRIGEAQGPRPADPRHRDRPQLRGRRGAAEARKWNVKAAIVMEKADLTLPQAMKRLQKADDLVRDAIGEDIEPTLRDAAEDLSYSARVAAASSSISSTSRCSCRNDAGSFVVIGPLHHAFDAASLRLPRRHQHAPPRVQDRRHPHRQRLSAAPRPGRRRTAPRCCGASRPSASTRCVRAVELARRLVEADVPVGADAEDLQVDPAGGVDRLLVALALRRRIGARRRRGS